MSPILGIWASQNYSRYSLPTSYESIATTTVGSGGSTSVTFSSIPSTYTHLQIRLMNLSATEANGILIRFNSDSGTNYAEHDLRGSGTAVNAYAYTSQTGAQLGMFGSSTAPGVAIGDILDYTNTNKYKTLRTLYGYDKNGGGYIFLSSGLWMSTNAITSITLSGGTFNQYSHFALYGIL